MTFNTRGAKSFDSLSSTFTPVQAILWPVAGTKLAKHLSEHKSSAVTSKSAVREHVVQSGGHTIDWIGLKVLERESKEISALQMTTYLPEPLW